MRFLFVVFLVAISSLSYAQSNDADSTIRSILTQELRKEEVRLAEAERKLATQRNTAPKHQDTQLAAEEVERCQENIQALKRELAYASKRGQLDTQVKTASNTKPVNYKSSKREARETAPEVDTSWSVARMYKNFAAYSVSEQPLNSRVVRWYVEK